MSSSTTFSLEEYQVQRKYRQEKRKEYLRKFQLLRHKMGISGRQPYLPKQKLSSRVSTPASKVQSNKNERYDGEEAILIKENERLKQELLQFEQKERKNLETFKQKIAEVKGKYIERITEINRLASEQQNSCLSKIQKLTKQIQAAQEKNKEIQDFNKKIQEEVEQSKSIMGKYSTQIKNEYAMKLEQFEKIFNSSTEKIQAMEQQFQNDEQFITNTLENEELIATIKENSEKASQDVQKILADYKELYEGKSEILKELLSNNEMKQKQINKMGELEQKLKTVFEKLNQQKRMYITENTKMAEELMEVKKLLMGNLPETEK